MRSQHLLRLTPQVAIRLCTTGARGSGRRGALYDGVCPRAHFFAHLPKAQDLHPLADELALGRTQESQQPSIVKGRCFRPPEQTSRWSASFFFRLAFVIFACSPSVLPEMEVIPPL